MTLSIIACDLVTAFHRTASSNSETTRYLSAYMHIYASNLVLLQHKMHMFFAK